MTLQSESLANIDTPAITLPADQYAHVNAPTEWWWHVGTLKSADGRQFGFEINATGMQAAGYAFAQIEITDIENQCNYQKVQPTAFSETWAEYDNTKPWFVKLPGQNGDGAISMSAIDNNPLNMSVQATFTDISGTHCALDLRLQQKGEPLLVWGTGCKLVNPDGTSPITQNNYYYSLTHLQASGSITIGSEVIEVTGLTWMDHEYGAFPSASPGAPVIWLLQDIQLENDLHLSNFTKFGVIPQEGVPMPSKVTLLYNGESVFLDAVTTPLAPTYVSDKNITYFMRFLIEVKDSPISFVVNSLYPKQVFIDEGPDVYEGVAQAEMIVNLTQKSKIVISTGTAWIEQNLG
ncbi:MAG TPA: lipocalin-like domain-containing protein [Pseudomonas sp.]|nr:lipocalin-like domain-containing protein [Pseudomonas sp.]